MLYCQFLRSPVKLNLENWDASWVPPKMVHSLQLSRPGIHGLFPAIIPATCCTPWIRPRYWCCTKNSLQTISLGVLFLNEGGLILPILHIMGTHSASFISACSDVDPQGFLSWSPVSASDLGGPLSGWTQHEMTNKFLIIRLTVLPIVQECTSSKNVSLCRPEWWSIDDLSITLLWVWNQPMLGHCH